MRRKDREHNDKAFTDQVLAEAEEICVGFATEGAPHVLYLNFAHVNGSLFIHCAPEGRKLDLIRRDARVGFTAATGVEILRDQFTTRYRSVCGTGTAEVVDDPLRKREALDAISERYQALCPRPTPEAMLARTSVIRIAIDTITGKECTGK